MAKQEQPADSSSSPSVYSPLSEVPSFSTSTSADRWYQPPYQSSYQPSYQGYYQTSYPGYYGAVPYEYGYNWYSPPYPGAQYPMGASADPGYPAIIKQECDIKKEVLTPSTDAEPLSLIRAIKTMGVTANQTKRASSSPPSGEPAAKKYRSLERKFPLQPGKPPYSYIALICMAIESRENAGTKGATLRHIFSYIENRFPFYRQRNKWYNSIRHTLTINDCFVKLPHRTGDKGCPWAIADGFTDMFDQGSLLRRGYRYKVGSARWEKAQLQKAMNAGSSIVGPKTSTPNDIAISETRFIFPKEVPTEFTSSQSKVGSSYTAQGATTLVSPEVSVELANQSEMASPLSPQSAAETDGDELPDCSFTESDLDSLDTSMYRPISPLPYDSGYEGKAQDNIFHNSSMTDLMGQPANCPDYHNLHCTY